MNKRHVFLIMFLMTVVFCWPGPTCWAQGDQPDEKIAVINIPQSSPSTVTVGPLVAQRGDQVWLSKAIADLLIKNLSEVQSLIILERERMQAFSDEVGLKDSALFNQEKALRVGRVAKVDKVIFGNYVLKGNTITVSVSLMDLKTQNILQQDEISGHYDDLHALIKELVFRFLDTQKVVLSESEKKNIQFEVTDSMTATEHFYRGIDFYDQGKYPEAFGEFLRAAKQDTKYFEAHLFVGKMFEAQGFYEHAVFSYGKLYTKYPQTVEGRDALFFAGQVLEFKLKDPLQAIEVYSKLAAIKPVNPHSLQASFRLGDLLQSGDEALKAYQEFKKIDDFQMSIINNPLTILRIRGRSSRFVTWKRALGLYKESVVKMITLYQRLIEELPEEERPQPPRGMIVLSAQNPVFKEGRFGHTPSMFPEKQKYPNWNEKLYVVAVPKGYVATGIHFSMTGRMEDPRPSYDYTMRILPFPLPRDFDQHWYGVIFGQTKKKTTLQKSVAFHGEQLEMFTIQVFENHSTIFDWGFEVRLLSKENIRPEQPAPRIEEADTFWEGKPIAHVPFVDHDLAGSTRLQQDIGYEPKKDMDLLHDPSTGNYLVVSQGRLDGQQTDLWLAHSSDTKEWSPLERLSINSSSEDYNPRLIRSEDGRIWLAWISTRRGKGWELWMSHQRKDKRWSPPQRIPLEKFGDTGMEKRIHRLAEELLEYDVFQDNRGRWIVVYYSYEAKALIFLHSKDTEKWSLLSKVPTDQAGFGFSLVQDSSARYRLGMIGLKRQLYLYSSNDAITWESHQMKFNFWEQSFFPTPKVHRIRLIPLELGRLLMLISDENYGLQFASFHADTGQPFLDLVSRVGLEAYAATKLNHEDYLVAIKEDEQVVLRKYKKFNVSGKEIDKDTRGWPIYKETEADRDENTWTRIFAQSRRIVPDVTALGLEPNGRVWWGIETGVMYKHGEQFMATDVSLGFFYHFITHITSCSESRVWFSSKYLNKPEIGVVKSPPSLLSQFQKTSSRPRFQRVWVPKATGAVTDLVCGQKHNHVYVGTSQGKVVGFDGKDVFFDYDLGPEYKISALTYNTETHELWAGTEKNGIYVFDAKGVKQHFDEEKGLASNQVVDLAVDQEAAVWVALYGNGLMHYKNGKWTHYTPQNSPLLYWSLGNLVADPEKGIWYLPHGDVRSKGLGYFDGKKGEVFNPPHHILPKPSSLIIEPNGVVWIGSWFNGLYRLERKGLKL